jgi:hypothetical protein
MLQPCRCRARRSIRISSDCTEVLALGASNTTEHHMGDFFFPHHSSRSFCAPRTCALFVIRTAHYS